MKLLFSCSLAIATATLVIGLAGDPEWLNVVNTAAYLELVISASMLLFRRLALGCQRGTTRSCKSQKMPHRP
jgi:hypothetical protein